MLTIHSPIINSNPECSKPVDNINLNDFRYYDKDGFELNLAERKFYSAMGFPLNPCLNHICWQEDWIDIQSDRLILDHALILHRASYTGEALEQIHQLIPLMPFASYLTESRQKWGFDLALDALDSQQKLFEVIHIEYDHLNYQEFLRQLDYITEKIYNMDWIDAASRIEQTKHIWGPLQGFEQNHWKANYLIGWEKAEYTDKTI